MSSFFLRFGHTAQSARLFRRSRSARRCPPTAQIMRSCSGGASRPAASARFRPPSPLSPPPRPLRCRLAGCRAQVPPWCRAGPREIPVSRAPLAARAKRGFRALSRSCRGPGACCASVWLVPGASWSGLGRGRLRRARSPPSRAALALRRASAPWPPCFSGSGGGSPAWPGGRPPPRRLRPPLPPLRGG